MSQDLRTTLSTYTQNMETKNNMTLGELDKDQFRSQTDIDNSVFRYLDVNTCHITEEDNELLSNPDSLIVNKRTHGWLVHVPELQCIDFNRILEEGFSNSLLKVLTKALILNCNFVLLDSDANEHADLDAHDW